MSGIAMVMMAGSGGGALSIGATATSTAAGSGSSTARVNYNSDGTMGGSQTYSGPANWYIPAATGVGANYWISFDGGAWQSLSGTRTTSITGGNASANRTVRIAVDAAGANIVATGNVVLFTSNGV